MKRNAGHSQSTAPHVRCSLTGERQQPQDQRRFLPTFLLYCALGCFGLADLHAQPPGTDRWSINRPGGFPSGDIITLYSASGTPVGAVGWTADTSFVNHESIGLPTSSGGQAQWDNYAIYLKANLLAVTTCDIDLQFLSFQFRRRPTLVPFGLNGGYSSDVVQQTITNPKLLTGPSGLNAPILSTHSAFQKSMEVFIDSGINPYDWKVPQNVVGTWAGSTVDAKDTIESVDGLVPWGASAGVDPAAVDPSLLLSGAIQTTIVNLDRLDHVVVSNPCLDQIASVAAPTAMFTADRAKTGSDGSGVAFCCGLHQVLLWLKSIREHRTVRSSQVAVRRGRSRLPGFPAAAPRIFCKTYPEESP